MHISCSECQKFITRWIASRHVVRPCQQYRMDETWDQNMIWAAIGNVNLLDFPPVIWDCVHNRINPKPFETSSGMQWKSTIAHHNRAMQCIWWQNGVKKLHLASIFLLTPLCDLPTVGLKQCTMEDPLNCEGVNNNHTFKKTIMVTKKLFSQRY